MQSSRAFRFLCTTTLPVIPVFCSRFPSIAENRYLIKIIIELNKFDNVALKVAKIHCKNDEMNVHRTEIFEIRFSLIFLCI